MARWFVKAEGIDPPMDFNSEDEAREWAKENVPSKHTIVSTEEDRPIGTFEDIPPS